VREDYILRADGLLGDKSLRESKEELHVKVLCELFGPMLSEVWMLVEVGHDFVDSIELFGWPGLVLNLLFEG